MCLRLPRSALGPPSAAPLSISQKTSLATFGIPPRTFLALAREGAFASVRVGKLRVATTRDVSAFLRSQRTRPAADASGPGDGLAAVLRSVGLQLKTKT